jgi:hypothetical protein
LEILIHKEMIVRRQWICRTSLVGLGVLAVLGGCHRAKTPVVTEADVAAAQEESQKELGQAKVEAKKDVKSAAKVAGVDSPAAAQARVTGAFDIAMAQADGARKVAIEKCMLLQPTAVQTCKDQAESDYQIAAANAKAVRVAKQQQ